VLEYGGVLFHRSTRTMDESRLNAAIDRFLASRPLYPCCLLVHREIRVLEGAAALLARRGWPVVSIGTVLGAVLRDLDPARRPARAFPVLSQAVAEHKPGPVLCVDADILFEPDLRLDPPRLLREISRVAPLVVTWAGGYAGGVLTYATADPPHVHYRAWRDPGLCEDCIVAL